MSKLTLRLRARDWAASAAAFAGVLACLVAIDPRVWHVTSQILSGSRIGPYRGVGDQVRVLASVVLDALKDQSADHTSMLVFAVVGVLLVGFMVRT